MRILTILFVLVLGITHAQQLPWSLKQCIDYAVENNLGIKQQEINKKNDEIRLSTDKYSRLPSLNASLGQNLDFGRSENREGIMVDKTSSSTSFSLSSSTPIFSGFKINHQIQSSKLNLEASIAELEQAKDNIALNVTSAYLQVLFNRDLYKIALSQVELTKIQLERTKTLVETGSLSQAELYESKATLAKDELNVIQNYNNLKLALLDLAQLLELENIEDFDIQDIELPDILNETVLKIQNPNDIYSKALNIKNSIKAAEFKLQSSKNNIKIAQSAYYPSLDFQAGYSNGYYKLYNSNNLNFGNQLDVNAREMLSLSLSIPIFNRMTIHNQVKIAKLNVEGQTLFLENTKKTLYKEIQQAYYSAVASKEKYLSSENALKASNEAFRYAQEKYSVGKSNSYEFNEAKTRMLNTSSEQAQAKYEYYFRIKILNFYSGESLY